MFLSTFEKQLDGKRRIVVPQDFRALASGPFDGVFCFPSIEADCLEGGGKALFDRYQSLIEELPFGDPLRSALETSIFGGAHQLSFGAGGYSRALLEAGAEVLALDRDPAAELYAKPLADVFGGRFTLVRSRFSELDVRVAEAGRPACDGVALDLGVSSMQLDEPERG